TQILPDGMVLLEVKCVGAMPLWLTGFLSAERIFKKSFSKYGTAYQMQLAERKMASVPQARNVAVPWLTSLPVLGQPSYAPLTTAIA
ncbi:MAG: hypothetical protein IKE22_06845, partial [Atopobiaceae bacterium]|nr:hypothetical protein [Atopobiaceae bacterium]